MTKCAVCLSILLLLVAAPTWAATGMLQGNTSTVQGTVGDADGAGLPGVMVTARNQDTGLTQTIITDVSGRYRVAGIPLGNYTITFALQGFATLERTDIVVRLDEELILDVSLELGAIEETITVSGAAPVIDVQNVVTQQNLSREALDILDRANG